MKIWRRVTVDGVFYRWMVEDVQTGKGADTFQRIITIRAEDHPESICKFVSDEIGHLWLFSATHSLVVKTRLVKACIGYALQNGWNPAESPQDYTAQLNRELLSRLIGPPVNN